MHWLTALTSAALVLAVGWLATAGLSLVRNYSAARSVGVPIRVIFISPLNPFWALFDRVVVTYLRQLPWIGDNSFTRYNWRGWEIRDRYRSHHEMGDIWILVTPFRNWVYVNDPVAIMSVFRRANDFPRPVFISEVLDVFGPNIATSDGEKWKIQRRIATHAFNEQNNAIVWSESITLAQDMLRYWTSRTSIDTIGPDLRTLSLHVLSRAGFGKSFRFEGHYERDASVSPSANYKQSLQTILENCVLILAFGTEFIAKPWLPRKFREVHEAWVSFRAYMTNLYEEEKRRFADGKASDHNLMTSLIRASQGEAATTGGLTESEIYGNMFAFNFAGHDTTANAFTFALYFLAAHPDVQDWLSEEIRVVLGGRQPHEFDYRTDFPRLKRCLSVLYETLRLYTPVPAIKWTADHSQPLTVGGKTVVLPPQSLLAPSYASLQSDPKYWGPDSLEWRPSRWVTAGDPGSEVFNMPARGSFVGWSEGARDCPGKKFSQAEFVATMAVLFLNSRVDPVPMKGESMDVARDRVMRLIESDTGYVLLLQMLHPERAPLSWRKP
ncbi:cytochrome P450 [Xylariomycetidae sp. FL0641]|nr:cytochrome P450 [Xylariomycetidae sp. FL0641]